MVGRAVLVALAAACALAALPGGLVCTPVQAYCAVNCSSGLRAQTGGTLSVSTLTDLTYYFPLTRSPISVVRDQDVVLEVVKAGPVKIAYYNERVYRSQNSFGYFTFAPGANGTYSADEHLFPRVVTTCLARGTYVETKPLAVGTRVGFWMSFDGACNSYADKKYSVLARDPAARQHFSAFVDQTQDLLVLGIEDRKSGDGISALTSSVGFMDNVFVVDARSANVKLDSYSALCRPACQNRGTCNYATQTCSCTAPGLFDGPTCEDCKCGRDASLEPCSGAKNGRCLQICTATAWDDSLSYCSDEPACCKFDDCGETLESTCPLEEAASSPVSVGGVVGGILGALAGVGLVGAAAAFFVWRRKQKDSDLFAPDGDIELPGSGIDVDSGVASPSEYSNFRDSPSPSEYSDLSLSPKAGSHASVTAVDLPRMDTNFTPIQGSLPGDVSPNPRLSLQRDTEYSPIRSNLASPASPASPTESDGE
jgi:hypothetical protein